MVSIGMGYCKIMSCAIFPFLMVYLWSIFLESMQMTIEYSLRISILILDQNF